MSEAQTLPEVDEDDQQGNEEDLETNEVDASEASTEEETEEEHEPKDEDDKSEDSDEEPTQKKPSGIQRRFQKFEARMAAQAQELEYWKKQAMGASGKPEQTAPVEKPKLADFDSVEEYVEARETYLRKELLAEVESAAVRKANQQSTQNSYMQKVVAAKSELHDWDEVMEEAGDEPTAPETVQFCMDSEIGPRIAYHLAKHPEFHDKLNAMSPVRRVAELGKLEDKLQTKSKPVAKPISKAPAKLSEVKGSAALTAPSVDNPRNYAEWKKADEARRKAAKR